MTPSPPLIDLNWPDAQWDVSGAFVYDNELLSFVDFCEQHLQIKQPLAWVHGAPPCSWNSGRLPSKSNSSQNYATALRSYYKHNIGILFTISNPLIAKEQLGDPSANRICEFLNIEGAGSGVIVSSEVLNDYVKVHYPYLTRISSILKITAERGKGKLDIYKRYLDDYEYVMLHPDDVFNLDLIEQLPQPERFIALVNEYCVRNCPIRHVHYQSLSEGALNYLGYDASDFEKRKRSNGCESLLQLLTHPTRGTLALTNQEIQDLYDRGLRHFKVQGRGMGNSAPLINDLMRLIWKEDAPQENRVHALGQLFWESITAPVQRL